jgi:arginyl-tRNA synthetase
VPVAFELARKLRKAPRAIAQEMAAAVDLSRVSSGSRRPPAGYLNFFLDRRAFLQARLGRPRAARGAEGGKVIVEHTAINPNKAAHIGICEIARSATRSYARCGSGRPVEVQNYIDDTGVQVADVVVGFTRARGQGPRGVRATRADPPRSTTTAGISTRA